MGWERDRYYTRSRKVNGRVVREYVGAGLVGLLSCQKDELARLDRLAARDAFRAQQAADRALDDELQALIDLADLAARAALEAAGFRQHKRGEWRKRRERPESTDAHGGQQGIENADSTQADDGR